MGSCVCVVVFFWVGLGDACRLRGLWVGILCGLDLEDIGLVVWVCAFGFGLGVWGIEESV